MISVFIDDTGSSGIITGSEFDSPERKCWVALVLNGVQASDVEFGMQQLTNELVTETGIREFHFTDVASGNKQFKNVALKRRQEYLEHFAMIYREMQYPLLIQSFCPEDYERNKIAVGVVKHHFKGFNFTDHSDMALVLLLVHLASWLCDPEKNPSGMPVRIVIDAGKQKPGTFRKCTLFGRLLPGRRLLFESSEIVPSLQFVDFAAYMLNRHRMTLMKKHEKTEQDIYLWQVFDLAKFNVLNMIKKELKLSTNTSIYYDSLLRKAYNNSDDFEEISLEDFVRSLYPEA